MALKVLFPLLGILAALAWGDRFLESRIDRERSSVVLGGRESLVRPYVPSRFTGAARELVDALLVNPYDLEEASAALATALSMAPEEQAERMRALRSHVAEFNVYRWAGRMLSDAARLRKRDRLSSRLSLGLRAVEEGRP